MIRLPFVPRPKARSRRGSPHLAQARGRPGAETRAVATAGRDKGGQTGKRNWIWPAMGFLVFVEVLLLGGHAVQWAKRSRHFALRRVVVAGHRALRPEDIVRLAALRPGSSIFDADLEAVRRRVASHPRIKRVRVRRRPPHFLQVDILERRPAALLARRGPLAVDGEGVVLGRPVKASARCLPLIEGLASSRLRPGDTVRDAGFARAVAAAVLFQDSPGLRDGCISVRDAGAGQLRLRALGGRLELMMGEGRMEEQAARFRAIASDVLQKENFGGGGLRVDLRFPGRVIVRPLVKDGGPVG